MKKLLLAGAAILLAAPALAADLPVLVAPIPVFNWTSCFMGAQFGKSGHLRDHAADRA
jgi:opacity protein-like surface antigen